MSHPTIAVDDPRADDVRALLAQHLAFANLNSPREDVHALDVAGLLDPALTFFGCRQDGQLLGIGALRWLPAAQPGDGDDGRVRSGASDVHGRGVRAVRPVRRLHREPEQHLLHPGSHMTALP